MIPKHLPKDVNGIWTQIDDYIDFQEGPGVRKYQYRETGIKLLNGSNINDNILDLSNTERYISEEEAYGKYKHFLVDAGDLLIASSGIVVERFDKKIAYAKKEHLPLCMNTSTIRFKSKDKSKLHLNYFRHFLATNYFKKQLGRLITGSAQLNFGPSHLKQMYVPLPSMEEQKRIAATLDKADAIRRKRQKAIDLTEQLLRSVFLDMFGDPVTNTKGWAVQSLDSACVEKAGVKAGPFGSALKKEFYTESGYRIYGQEQVIAGTLNIGDYYIDEAKYLKLESCSVMSGDMLISLVGSIGKTLVVPDDFEPGIINPRLVRIRPNKELLLSEYLQQLFKQPRFQMQLSSHSHGGTMPILNAGILKGLEIQLPPVELQSRFISILKKIEIKMKNFITAQTFNENLFSSLTQQAFSGELSKQTKAA